MSKSHRKCVGRLLAAIFGAILVSGCTSGPYQDPGYDIPSPNVGKNYSEIIVSGFITADKATTVTRSMEIETIMESVSIYDMSHQIASALQQSGVKAEARDKFDRKSLRSDQLLLRGAVIASSAYDDGLGIWLVPYILTLGLFGCWAPSPFTYDTGYEIRYRVELIDSNGRFLLSTDSKDSRIFVTSRNILVGRPGDEVFFDLMRKSIAAEIAKKVRL